MNHRTAQFSIWSYVGGMLMIYGLLLLAGGAYQVWHPPATVLAKYHATFYAGVVLMLAGLALTFGARPGKRNR